MAELSSLRNLLDYIPEAKSSVFSCLYPFDIAKLLVATGHILTERERCMYINPLSDIMEDPGLMSAASKSGIRMIVSGSHLETLKSRLEDPEWYMWAKSSLAVEVFLFADGLLALGPMWRFVYGMSHEPREKEPLLARHMASAVRVYDDRGPDLHTIVPPEQRGLLSPKGHDTRAVVYTPSDACLRRGHMMRTAIPFYGGYHTVKEGYPCIPWAEVTESLAHPGIYEVGPINYARLTDWTDEDDPHLNSETPGAECYKNIVICGCVEVAKGDTVIYKIPVGQSKPQGG